jgi:hypothetical protein
MERAMMRWEIFGHHAGPNGWAAWARFPDAPPGARRQAEDLVCFTLNDPATGQPVTPPENVPVPYLDDRIASCRLSEKHLHNTLIGMLTAKW